MQKIKYGNEIHLGTGSYKLADEYAIASNKKGSYLVITKNTDLNEHNLFYDQINNYLKEDEIEQLDTISSLCFVLKDEEDTDSGLRVIELILFKKVLLVVKTNKHQINSNYYCGSISVS